MAAKNTAAELGALQEAIQSLQNGAAKFSVDGVSYEAVNLSQYLQREKELLRRLSIRNVRKRTFMDFS